MIVWQMGFFLLLTIPHHSPLRDELRHDISEQKKICFTGVPGSRGGGKGPFLECAGELAEEDDFSRQGLCSTTWLWENTGRSKRRARQ